MKKIVIFNLCYFLCFLFAQVVFSEPRYPSDDVSEKIFDDLKKALDQSLRKTDYQDWKNKISSFGRSVQMLERNKQEFLQKCRSECEKNNSPWIMLDCDNSCNSVPEYESGFYANFSKDIKSNKEMDTSFKKAFENLRKNIELKPTEDVNNINFLNELSNPLNYLKINILSLVAIILVAIAIFVGWQLLFMTRKQKSLTHKGYSMKSKPKGEPVNDITTPEQSNPQLPTTGHRSNDITTSVVINQFWRVVGASVIGKSHLDNIPPLPCQDSHSLEEDTEKRPKWGVAVVCDGAGSATHSHYGSQFVAKKVAQYFKAIANELKWHKKMPTQQQWHQSAKEVLLEVRRNLESYANEKNVEIKALACTVIVVIFSPAGLLVTHIGDGRGGYRNDKGEWKSFLTPFKGEEANQTVFMTSDIWSEPDKYIESRIIDEPFTAFVMMSDGCESHCFQTHNPDKTSEQFRLIDVNTPHSKFFEPLFNTIQAMEIDKGEELRQKWAEFIQSGKEGLKNEPDDKTMIIRFNPSYQVKY